MQINQVIAVTTLLAAVIISVVVYMNYAAGGDGHQWDKSKWTVTMADGTTSQTWWVDLNQGIKISTLAADHSSTFNQEFVGDKQYSYFSRGIGMGASGFNCDDYDGMPNGVTCESLKAQMAVDFETLTGDVTIDQCTVADANVSVEQVTVKDGSLNVGGFIVTVENGKPSAIMTGDNTLIATITNVETYSEEVVFGGCVLGNGDRRHLMEKIEEAHARRLSSGVVMTEAEIKARAFIDASYMEMIPGAKEFASSRQLLNMAELTIVATGTHWCGAGTDLVNTACPNAAERGDFYCYRHDHGAKNRPNTKLFGGYIDTGVPLGVISGCDIDNSLAYGTNNLVVQLVFGAWGSGQFYGCDDYGSYDCWAWTSTWVGGYWWYGTYCSGETVRYGPTRFTGSLLNPLSCSNYQGVGCGFKQRWGFKARKRTTCANYNIGPTAGPNVENNPTPSGFFWAMNCPKGTKISGAHTVCV